MITANTATREATDMTATTPTVDTIRVLFVEPMEKPKLITIDHTLETLQKLVDGYIQALYPWGSRYNEAGKRRRAESDNP